MVRSTSSFLPMSGSMRPSWAMRFKLVVYFSSALPPSPSRSASVEASSLSVDFSSAIFESPCEM